MKLPFALRAFASEEKLRAYLLVLQHPKGGPKARFFIARGFSLERWQDLGEALHFHAWTGEAVKVGTNEHGEFWRVSGPLICPNGQRPLVWSIWCVQNKVPRLITAYPGGRRVAGT